MEKCFECDERAQPGSNYCSSCFDILLATMDGGLFPDNPCLDWMRYNGFLTVRV